MRASQFFISTLKEVPAEAELVSHKLMIRAGLIRRLGSGLYTWMPLGLRVLKRVEQIVREEMNRAGAIELLMPAVQPAELWEASGRWAAFGPQMLKMKDRHERWFCFGPTHEEVITYTAQRELKSYRQLPINFYQIQTKFRDEIRPRFGVMRAREFLMKDAYSFHADYESLKKTYQDMYDAYNRIFERLGLHFRSVDADPGAIGGSGSREFHVLAESGEDALAFCPDSDYAANVELAEALQPEKVEAELRPMQKVHTPNEKTCEAVAELINRPLTDTVKTIAIMAGDQFVLLLLRGDHMLNEVKVQKIAGLEKFRFATDAEIKEALNCPAGFLGPVGVDASIRIIADRSVAVMSNFICGANEALYHLADVNFDRDLPMPETIADIRNVVENDPSPDGKGNLLIRRGIEVGHIFQLGTKYSQSLNATFLDENGQPKPFVMGCYGIGVSRIVAAAIEQNYDERGIIFTDPIAPFSVAIAPIGLGKSEAVKKATETIYQALLDAGIDVLLDDRQERPGAMFADLELMGIPRRIVIGDRGLKENIVEYQARRDTAAQTVSVDEIVAFVQDKIQKGE